MKGLQVWTDNNGEVFVSHADDHFLEGFSDVAVGVNVRVKDGYATVALWQRRGDSKESYLGKSFYTMQKKEAIAFFKKVIETLEAKA